MWIVATYRNEPADIKRRRPTQNMSYFELTADQFSIMMREKYASTVAIGAERVKLYGMSLNYLLASA
jgi:hypothetical protein